MRNVGDVIQTFKDKEQLEPMLTQLTVLPESLGKADTLLADISPALKTKKAQQLPAVLL